VAPALNLEKYREAVEAFYAAYVAATTNAQRCAAVAEVLAAREAGVDYGADDDTFDAQLDAHDRVQLEVLEALLAVAEPHERAPLLNAGDAFLTGDPTLDRGYFQYQELEGVDHEDLHGRLAGMRDRGHALPAILHYSVRLRVRRTGRSRRRTRRTARTVGSRGDPSEPDPPGARAERLKSSDRGLNPPDTGAPEVQP
jgi:hypothetical protein